MWKDTALVPVRNAIILYINVDTTSMLQGQCSADSVNA